jgi:hypothetical protein
VLIRVVRIPGGVDGLDEVDGNKPLISVSLLQHVYGIVVLPWLNA